MTVDDLINDIARSGTFRFTKPSFDHEKPLREEQRRLMDKLLANELVDQVGRNEYRLSQKGYAAKEIGFEKWKIQNEAEIERVNVSNTYIVGNKNLVDQSHNKTEINDSNTNSIKKQISIGIIGLILMVITIIVMIILDVF